MVGDVGIDLYEIVVGKLRRPLRERAYFLRVAASGLGVRARERKPPREQYHEGEEHYDGYLESVVLHIFTPSEISVYRRRIGSADDPYYAESDDSELRQRIRADEGRSAAYSFVYLRERTLQCAGEEDAEE